MKVMKYLFCVVFFALSVNAIHATHNRSGEITYRQIGPLTIEATITTYTKASSTGADRDTLLLFWGDGTSTSVPRDNGDGDILTGYDIKVNYYIAEHTYPGRATYTMFFTDPNRVENIQNLNFPNSLDIRFYIQTTFTLFDSQFNGLNNSAILLQPPLDFACANQIFKHNPNAYDPDGDSLAYELIVPFQGVDSIVPNYQYPDEIGPGPNNQISLDERTGEFVWDAPVIQGEYNIAIKIKEYRQGQLVNSIIRDMQILVTGCENNPPVIDAQEEYCVWAGDLLEIPIAVTDEDEDQLIQLTVTGGALQEEEVVIEFDNNGVFKPHTLNDTLRWQTTCLNVKEQPYQFVFRAQDNGISTNQGLSDLKTVLIYVMGPPPLDLVSEVENQGIDLSWELPYICNNPEEDYFRGFSVWKKIGSNPFEPDSCTAGLDGKGYDIIAYLIKDTVDGRYYYRDEDIEAGKVYCYRVLANFSLKTNAAVPQLFNFSRSIPSNEVCATANRIVPLLTAADVRTTSTSDGEIFVSWLKPIARELDTLENPGPYLYQLQRSLNGIDYVDVPGARFESEFFDQEVDTSFLDTGLNTVASSYFYQVDFKSNSFDIGVSPSSESPYLSIASTDKRNDLSWGPTTSWQNYEYEVYKYNDISGDFELLSNTEEKVYEDRDLINGQEYCYKIRTIGTYGIPETPEIIFNYSQEVCAIPLDTIGPCPPPLDVTNDCENLETLPLDWELVNNLSWLNPAVVCEDSEDIAGYELYYSSLETGDFVLINTLNSPSLITDEHIPEEGSTSCYYLVAFDFEGNYSAPSDTICLSNCPQFELPNTFTPNGDGANDVFIPRQNKFIDRINFQLFNEWGNKIFETQEPSINWDGTDLRGREVDAGVYYYTCQLLEESENGEFLERSSLSGFVQVLR